MRDLWKRSSSMASARSWLTAIFSKTKSTICCRFKGVPSLLSGFFSVEWGFLIGSKIFSSPTRPKHQSSMASSVLALRHLTRFYFEGDYLKFVWEHCTLNSLRNSDMQNTQLVGAETSPIKILTLSGVMGPGALPLVEKAAGWLKMLPQNLPYAPWVAPRRSR